MSEEANKARVLKYVNAFNRGDIETLESLFAPDALVYGVLGWGGLAPWSLFGARCRGPLRPLRESYAEDALDVVAVE